MDVHNDIAPNGPLPPSPVPAGVRFGARAAWVIGLAALALVAALAFGAYRQPELLLNLIGLRYCG